MIESVITFCIRNRLLVILTSLAVAGAGVYAVYHTPVDAIPDLSENQVIVFTEWPGHSPREIEDQVTYPLSLQLQGLAGVRVVRSSSDVSFSMISVIFEDGVGLDLARRQTSERLAALGSALPPGVVPRLAPDAAATGQIYWYTVEGPQEDLGRLRALHDWYIRPQLASVPGVAEVASVGGFPPEYQVELNPVQLQAHGLAAQDVLDAVARANVAVGAGVVHKGNAEFVVRGAGWLGSGEPSHESSRDRVITDLRKVAVPTPDGGTVALSEIASIAAGGQPRRGVLEKDGNEVTGGVVLMRTGENPLEVTRRLKQKIQELQPGLPPGVRIVSFYDRTPLIEGAIGTVTGTLLEAILTASFAVLLVLRHFRTSFVITLTLPLAVLASFAAMALLRWLGVADIQTNIMSLAGIAISIGVLVDSSVVMAENAMHHLKEHFGDRPVRGDIRALVLPACRTVGRPIFFSVVIMLLSFLPVFALGGMEGKMFRPLAFTKSFALVAVALLAITLVPALCTVFIKGRLRREEESWLVRGVVQVYRPVLNYFLDHPAALVWVVGVTFLLGLAPAGARFLFLTVLAVALVIGVTVARSWPGRVALAVSLVLVALLADQRIEPLGREFMTPLDEGMIMDMPITVPRASVAQAADDLKARDMVFCRFPEVDMVVGKAGRAETPLDPAPLDMIETMVNFRPQEFWPRRKLRTADAEAQGAAAFDLLLARGLIRPPAEPETRDGIVNAAVMEALPLFDSQMREYAYQRNQEFQRDLGVRLVRFTADTTIDLLAGQGAVPRPVSDGERARVHAALHTGHSEHLAMSPELGDVTAVARATGAQLVALGLVADRPDLLTYRPNPVVRAGIFVHTSLGGQAPTFFTRVHTAVLAEYRALWRQHVAKLNGELLDRGPTLYTRLVLEEVLSRCAVTDRKVLAEVRTRRRRREGFVAEEGHHPAAGTDPHAAMHRQSVPPADPVPALDNAQRDLTLPFARRLLLWPAERSELAGFGGELDRAMQMPGWTNVWTMPIQNRVDMLATGVNTAVGVRVLGRNLDDVVKASEEIARILKRVRGAADVVADPMRGKGYLEVRPNRDQALRFGLSVAEINDVVETALSGKVVTTTVEGRERHPVRVRFGRSWREDEESVRNLPVAVRTPGGRDYVPLSEVAQVSVTEGPATIKSENGLLRNYVRLNVRGRGTGDFVEEARAAVARQATLPPGVFVEWTGQFEHEVHARRTLTLIVPVILGLIFLTLYLTYRDLFDAVLMLLAVPGAVAGGVFFQWLFGYKFSVPVLVGYIACFGMATSTGVIMLVYLREAVEKAGGLANLTLTQLRQAVMDGAVHRLRPKLLTECTTVIGLAPLLVASGTGAEVIRPMVVPVLGGILIADEVIDLFLPVLFYWGRRWRWQRLHGGNRATVASP